MLGMKDKKKFWCVFRGTVQCDYLLWWISASKFRDAKLVFHKALMFLADTLLGSETLL